MVDKPSLDGRVLDRSNITDDRQSVGLVLRIIRRPTLAYILIALVLAFGVGAFDSHQRERQAASDNRARIALKQQIYDNCTQQELIKRQANERIGLLKRATGELLFKNPKVGDEVKIKVRSIRPLPTVDCEPLRPIKK